MSTIDTTGLPDYAPVPRSAMGSTLNEQGYFVGRVERNLYWVTDGSYQCAFLTTSDGVVLLDAPPSIGHNIQRAVDEIASANGVSNKVNYLIYSHHHADHVGASSLFDKNVTRIGHEETRRLLLRDGDSARPPNEETFQDRRTLDDVTLHQQYMADISESSRKAIDTVDPTRYFVKYGENAWAAVKGYLDEITAVAAAPVIEKYTGVLAAADVFTESTTFWVMESIRLDLGYGSQVHP